MLNPKLSAKASTLSSTRPRSKSIYRGDQSHTLSMHLRIDNELSPQTTRFREGSQLYKQTLKQIKVDKFRDSLRIVDTSHSGKKSQREDPLQKQSAKKLSQTSRQLKTERVLKSSTNLINVKENYGKLQKSPHIATSNRKQNKQNAMVEQVKISEEDFKQIIKLMKDLQNQNKQLKREIKFFAKHPKSSVAAALRK